MVKQPKIKAVLLRDVTQRAAYCYGKVVSLSVTLRYRDHIGWSSSKIISLLVSLGCSIFADSNITHLLQGEHPGILTGIGEGYLKSGFRRTNTLMSLKRGKIEPRLLLRTNRKSYTLFRSVQKINDLR